MNHFSMFIFTPMENFPKCHPSLVHSIRTSELSVLDLVQFWDMWPCEQFHRKCVSEDKARWNRDVIFWKEKKLRIQSRRIVTFKKGYSHKTTTKYKKAWDVICVCVCNIIFMAYLATSRKDSRRASWRISGSSATTYLVTQRKDPWQLSVLDLVQFWDMWPCAKFHRTRASEDKTRWSRDFIFYPKTKNRI